MSQIAHEYEDHLEYLPSKERKAAEKALYTENDTENMVMAIIRNTNSSNPEPENPQKRRRNDFERF